MRVIQKALLIMGANNKQSKPNQYQNKPKVIPVFF
jgi:hypothetical protein